eukprot:TRINITY_DN11533_c0_g1_i1.p1 TRINITY_DN11533_c0_g1~~TRINITY_DN11533_c0_g1_i1.p1  ORF type:complete len:717 (+),score=180.81 TRINITY_DN11533_c0_g1_i1:33-2183(+)
MLPVLPSVFLLCIVIAHSAEVREKVGQWERSDDSFYSDAKHTLRLSLKQRNLDVLERKVWSVSDPLSSDYGNYLTHEQIASIIGLPQPAINTVIAWLEQNGAENIDLNRHKDMIQASFTVKQLQEIFGTEFSYYSHPVGKKILRPIHEVSIPEKIAPFVELMHGVNDFPPMMQRKLALEKAEKARMQEKLKKTYKPYEPVFSFVGSRGDSKAITVKWIPTDADGKFETDPHFTAVMEYSFNFESGTASTAQFILTSDLCELTDNYLSCTYDIKDEAIPFHFITDLTLSTIVGEKRYSSVYPFPIAPTSPIVPQKLWDFYGVPRNPTINNALFTQCVVEFEQQYYSPTDLQQFFSEMGIPANATVTTIGDNDASNPGGEANLDIQWMMAMAPGIPTVFWSIASNSTLEIDDILQWAYAIGNQTNPPLVNSISYGMTAINVDKYLGKGYLVRSDIQFMKLAAMGITVIIADGDNGAGDLGDPPMLRDTCKTKLNPDWPSQSPYVTAVGSTYITPLAEPICYLKPSEGGIDCTKFMPEGEVGVSLDNGMFWSTGGGFADYPARPNYQTPHVTYFLNTSKNLPPSSYFNSAGRAYPDVSAVGHNLITVIAGKNVPVDGTSASAPIFGGIVSLLTDIRLKAGKAPLGFLNPLLYQIARDTPDAFYDVVVGENKCSQYSMDGPSCCPYGYSASPGWDPVTGLGTPNFKVLSEAVLKYATQKH